MIECAFTGRLGKDAELRHVKGGSLALLSFSAALEERIQTGDAPPTWVRVAVFGDQAEQLCDRLVKGTRVYIEGRLEASIWQPEHGPVRVNLNVAATLCQPLGQIGKRRPQPTRQRTWDRSRDIERHATPSRPQAAGEAILQERGRDRTPEPPQSWLDDTEAAISDHEVRGQ